MAYLITLGELIDAAKLLANDTTIERPEIKLHVSRYYGRAHGEVVGTGARYFETEAAVDLGTLALPADHRSTIGIDFIRANGRREELPEIQIHERDMFTGLTGTEARGWSVVGTSIQLFPLPTTGTYKILYEPQPAVYDTSSDSTQIDVMTSDGREMIEWGVASVLLHRSIQDQQRALLEYEGADGKGGAKGRLREWALKRSITQPKRRQVTTHGWGGSDRGLHGLLNEGQYRR